MSNTWCACTGRAQSARIAAARPSRHAGPTALACSAAPRHTLPSSQERAKQPPPRPAGQTLAATAARQPCAVQRRPSHPGSPPGPWSSALSSTSSCRHPQPRHVALQATARRFAGELIRPPRNRPRRAIKGGPRASPCTQEALECSPSPPMAANRPGGGLLPHLRQLQPLPLPRPIRHHQGLPLSVLSTNSFLTFP